MERNEFSVLVRCMEGDCPTQRQLADACGLSLGTVNATVRALVVEGLVDADHAVTPAGAAALEPYRVRNAVIMAAGLSSRFAPISYERPKGVLKVRGEVLIERQIRQLQEAGINDITVVVGYKKEEFFYLEDAFGVKLVINADYASRNNNSTIKRVEGILGNTYICSSDDYFTGNPFESYVYASYYAAVYHNGLTGEYCLETRGKADLITGVSIGGADAWVMMGHAYWDHDFAHGFTRILDEVYDDPETPDKLWEDIYADHIADLPMHMRKYPADAIWEFDSLDELRGFDPYFMENIDSGILDNICATLKCGRDDIKRFEPVKQGLTNLSVRFDVAGESYVYRHPGFGTDEIIDRASEAASQAVARDLGLDATFVYEDPDQGWKISRFLEGRSELDYHDWGQVESAMHMARTLHDSGADTGFPYDMHQATRATIGLLGPGRRTAFRDFAELLAMADELNEQALSRGARTCLCHNDFYAPNFLVAPDGDMQLIDWEYSGMSDYASDLGVFVCCCEDYSYEDVLRVLELYFGREPDSDELFHCMAYFSVVAFYWFVWALYKEECGDPVGEFLYLWYKYAKSFGQKARELIA